MHSPAMYFIVNIPDSSSAFDLGTIIHFKLQLGLSITYFIGESVLK